MITLDVESYCHNCDAFDPKVTRIEFQNFNMCETTSETRVSCKDSKKCANMYRHLKMEVVKNGQQS